MSSAEASRLPTKQSIFNADYAARRQLEPVWKMHRHLILLLGTPPRTARTDGAGIRPRGGDPAGTGRRRRGRSSSGRPSGGERGGDGIRSWMQVGTIDGGNDDGRCWMGDSGPTATGRPRRLPRRTRRGSVRGGPPAGIVWRRTQGDDDAGDVKYEWREASGKVVQWALFARGGRRHLVLGAGGHH